MQSFAVAEVAEQDWSETKGWKPLVPLIQLGQEGQWGRIEDYEGVGKNWRADLQAIKAAEAAAPGSEQQEAAGVDAASALESRRFTSPESIEPPSPPASIVPEEQYRISKAWEGLHERLEKEGYYDAKPLWNYKTEVLRYFGLFFGFLWVFHNASSTWHYYAAAVLLGLCWHQVTFVVHDAGHTEVFGSYHADRVLGSFIASWFGGLSVGWWCDNHNIHHLVTNHPEHDPDIQHIPFFAISTRFFGNLYSTYYRRTMLMDAASRFFVSIQHKLYYIVMSLARFNLFANSYTYLLFKAKPDFYRNLELVGVAFFWLWFGGGILRNIPDVGTRIGFVVLSFMVTSPLHVQIVLSHFAQSTEDLGLYESFPARQLRTTMDVTCHENIEFVHGGLNMQVTHHLFPRLPRHHLRAASALIKEFAKQQGLEYHTYHFIEGNGRVLDVLRGVADQVHVLGKVASAQARGELHAH